jgi:P27 family predicted phage terminase small subunit
MTMLGRKPNLTAIEGGLADCPAPPQWLSPEAKGEWRRILPGLVERRIVADEDLSTVASYCTAIGQVQVCQRVLDEADSMFVQSDRSAPRPHPAIRVMHGAQTLARQLAAELGLTPVSRHRATKIAGAEESEDGWTDDLLA